MSKTRATCAAGMRTCISNPQRREFSSPLSSSAKADDPAFQRRRLLRITRGVLDTPPSRGVTAEEEVHHPIASATRPSVPTMTRHQANTAKPWRVTYPRKAFTTMSAVMKETTKPIAMRLR
jgi:hypothetical protein